jgi:hypothetical protein
MDPNGVRRLPCPGRWAADPLRRFQHHVGELQAFWKANVDGFKLSARQLAV